MPKLQTKIVHVKATGADPRILVRGGVDFSKAWVFSPALMSPVGLGQRPGGGSVRPRKLLILVIL